MITRSKLEIWVEFWYFLKGGFLVWVDSCIGRVYISRLLDVHSRTKSKWLLNSYLLLSTIYFPSYKWFRLSYEIDIGSKFKDGMCVCVLPTQWCPAICDPIDCSLLGCSVHGILQGRIPEWVAISISRGPSWPRDQTQVSCVAGRFFTVWATRDAHVLGRML